MKRVAILGSTGSVGRSAVDVALHLGLPVGGMATRANWRLLREQIGQTRPQRAAVADAEAFRSLRTEIDGTGTTLHEGEEGVRMIATADETDGVLCAISGAACLGPVLEAAERGKTIALANKESLVMAGPLLLEVARKAEASIIPVDSEHSAVFQAMRGSARSEVRRIFLTASGGPFARMPRGEFDRITPEQALRHPVWNMGAKITVDSSTMFNKALEIIEAKWLFGLDAAQIVVIIHPQSIVHSMVEFVDGSVIAQLGVPDMRTPIQYAFTYPDRAPGKVASLNLAEVRSLTFEEPDLEKFPSIGLGYRAAEVGGTMGAVLNAANEVAVQLFLERKIPFPRIFEIVRRVMDRHVVMLKPTLEDVFGADRWAREEARCC